MKEFIDSDGTEYEVVWDGADSLIGDRTSKPNGLWDAPDLGTANPTKRIYNKTGNHTKNKDFWTKREFPLVENPIDEPEEGDTK